MTSEKPTASLFARLMAAMKERTHRVLQVIDEALDSENLKDRIWAVEQILKRVKPGDDTLAAPNTENNTGPAAPSAMDALPDDWRQWDTETLLMTLQRYLKSPPEVKAQDHSGEEG